MGRIKNNNDKNNNPFAIFPLRKNPLLRSNYSSYWTVEVEFLEVEVVDVCHRFVIMIQYQNYGRGGRQKLHTDS